jgi:hypothetical protein
MYIEAILVPQIPALALCSDILAKPTQFSWAVAIFNIYTTYLVIA